MRLHCDFLSNRGLLGFLLAFFLHYILLLPAPATASPLANSVDLLDALNLTSTLSPHVLAKRFYEAELSGPLREREGPVSGPPPVSDYPSNDQIREAFLPGMEDRRFVFYSMVDVKNKNGKVTVDGSTVARNFAQGLTDGGRGAFLRDCYPLYYTNMKPGRNALRRSNMWYQDFADRFSGVMADNASGDVYFLFNRLDWTPQDQDTRTRVWARVEYPTLIQNEKVTRIIIVHWDTEDNIERGRRTLWSRGDNTARAISVNETAVTLTRRAAFPDGGFNWMGCGEDPGDPYSSGYRPCCG